MDTEMCADCGGLEKPSDLVVFEETGERLCEDCHHLWVNDIPRNDDWETEAHYYNVGRHESR